ncbi:hypothetical protein BG015_010057 [Linnemannia schmuckeri]|uniref:Uncharacterized protein n=1 Tax=Linnemannia schmuckeri TaxID=64567 RepID=A0A9P5RY20_9FUNG|nr:hypothetical protein BG015_010057 [Linnemannia schmuckeri]
MIGEYPTHISRMRARKEREEALDGLRNRDSSYHGLRAPILGLDPKDTLTDKHVDKKAPAPSAPKSFPEKLFSAFVAWICGGMTEDSEPQASAADDKKYNIPEVSTPCQNVSTPAPAPAPCALVPFPKWTSIPRVNNAAPYPYHSRWGFNLEVQQEVDREMRKYWDREQNATLGNATLGNAKEITHALGASMVMTATVDANNAATVDSSKMNSPGHVDDHKTLASEYITTAVPAEGTTKTPVQAPTAVNIGSSVAAMSKAAASIHGSTASIAFIPKPTIRVDDVIIPSPNASEAPAYHAHEAKNTETIEDITKSDDSGKESDKNDEDDEDFSSMADDLIAIIEDGQSVQEEHIQCEAPLIVATPTPTAPARDDVAFGLPKTSTFDVDTVFPTSIASKTPAPDTHDDNCQESDEDDEDDDDFSSLAADLILSIEGGKPAQEKKTQQETPLPTPPPTPAIVTFPRLSAPPHSASAPTAFGAGTTLASHASPIARHPTTPAAAFSFKCPTSLTTTSKPDINFAPSAVTPSLKFALSTSAMNSRPMDITLIKPAMSVASATSTVPATTTASAFKPAPLTISTTASATDTTSTSPSNSKSINPIVMPPGRPIARMRTKTPSITPVVVMPPGRAIAKPRRSRK